MLTLELKDKWTASFEGREVSFPDKSAALAFIDKLKERRLVLVAEVEPGPRIARNENEIVI